MPEDDSPVLDTLAEMTATSIEHSDLEAREHMLVRLAALVAVGAPAVSFLLNAGTAADVGVTIDDVQDVLVAVAPIVGTARVARASGNIAKALGFAIAVAEAELEAEMAEEDAG
jgi:alkylhydroperoxidase/carboxymuconolactone decarboxylase family protein YurZ